MKKNWNVAKIFTLLITVSFLASTLFVGCKEQEPEPGPVPSPVMYTVTYAVEGGGNSVTGIPEPKTVEKGTVLKVDDLPTLTEPEGWTFEGWYIGEEPFTSDYTVTSNIIITAKFVENVAPSLPENPVEPDTTNNFNGNYYAGEDDMGYIEFTNETDCVVFVVSAVPAKYTVADNVATIKGVKVSDEEDYSEIEIKTTALANDSFSVTYPVEICKMFDPDASENMVITYTKADKPSSEGGEGGTTPPAGGEEDSTTPDTTNNFNGNYYAGKDGDTDFGYIEFTTETECVVYVVSEVPATYTVADNVATIKGEKISDEEDYSAIEIKTTTLANDSFSVTYPVEICKMFDPAASEDMVITYTKVDNPSSGGGEGVVVPDPDPVETFLVTYTVEGIDANLVTGLPETGSVNKDTVLPLSPLEEPEGYVFDGWYINDEGVSQHTVVADVTIVAKFSEKAVEYTIKNADSSWQNIVVYAWKDDGDDGFFSAVNDGGTVTFVANIPIEKCILILLKEDIDVSKVLDGSVSAWDNRETQTLDLIIDGDNIATIITEFVEKVYLKPNSNWLQEGDGKTPRFAAVFIPGGDWNKILWVNMIADDDMFVCDVPKGYDQVQFCRMNGNTEDNNWDNKYNNSNTLAIPFLGDYNILCTIPDGGWSDVGSWSTKE